MSRVAVLQMNSAASIQSNLQRLEPLFVDAYKQSVQLIILPENFASMCINESDKMKIAEDYGCGIIQDCIASLAKQYHMWVVAGSLLLKAKNQKLHSACLVYDAKGSVVARYDKMHLFDVTISDCEAYQESLLIKGGENVVVVDTPVGRVGLSICYDLRFPELYQQLTLKGAEIFAIPAAFTANTGKAHWNVLLRARAIENLAYVLAANQVGRHANGRETFGHSMVIGPWGTILGAKIKNSGIVVRDIDLEELRRLRRQFPCNDHHILVE